MLITQFNVIPILNVSIISRYRAPPLYLFSTNRAECILGNGDIMKVGVAYRYLHLFLYDHYSLLIIKIIIEN
jgi:hypothetical protein